MALRLALVVLALVSGRLAAAEPAPSTLPRYARLQLGTPRINHNEFVTCLVFSPDGRLLATGVGEQTLRIWDAREGKLLHSVPGPKNSICALYPTADGKGVTSLSQWGGLRTRDWQGDILATIAEQGAVEALALSPNRRQVARSLKVGGMVDQVELWNPAVDRGEHVLGLENAEPTAVRFSSDSENVAVGGSKGQVGVWSATTGRCQAILKGEESRVWSLAFAPDGGTIAGGCENGRIMVWENASGQAIAAFRAEPAALCALAFDPRGRLLAAAGHDHMVRIWDPLLGKELRTLEGHRDIVYALAFSPDGRTLASGSRDGTVLLWDVAELSAGAEARSPAARELEDWWADLADKDAARAAKAVRAFSAHAEAGVPFLRDRLARITITNEDAVDRWIADLDGASFASRRKAMAELEKLGLIAEPALRRTLESKPPLEVARRVEELLRAPAYPVTVPEVLRLLRGARALEQSGTAEAQKALEQLAREGRSGVLSQRARAALDRLRRLP